MQQTQYDDMEQDKDGKWNLKEIQEFATATNGRPVSLFEID